MLHTSPDCHVDKTQTAEDRVFFCFSHILNKFLRYISAEETFGSVGFESIFAHLEIISTGRPIKVLNDNIDISKSSSFKRTKNFTWIY